MTARTGLTSLKLWPADGTGNLTSASSVNYSIPFEIGDCDTVGVIITHTANISGTLDVQFSNETRPVTSSYESPNASYFTTSNNIGWTTDSTLSQSVATTSSGSVLCSWSRVGFRWARTRWTSGAYSGTNTGRLGGHANGKG